MADRQRREHELGHELQHAFDDLLPDDDDDDETLDNSYRSGTSFRASAQAVDTERKKRNYLHMAEENGSDGGGTDAAIARLRIELQSKTNELVHVSKV